MPLIALTMLCCGCATVDLARTVRQPSQALADISDSRLAGTFLATSTDPSPPSTFRLIADSRDALAVRAALADAADKTLDLQYYIVRSDVTGLLLLERLLNAADRGVRVRLLADDLNFDRGNAPLLALDAHENAQVRIFNPFLSRYPLSLVRVLEFLSDWRRLNRRMHNKLYVADNVAALVGGRNLGDEYFQAHGTLDLHDLDLLAGGPVVRNLSASFDEFWNNHWAVPISALRAHDCPEQELAELRALLQRHGQKDHVRRYRQGLAASVPAARIARRERLAMVAGPAWVLADRPCKLIPGQSDCLLPQPGRIERLLREADGELLVISPYFIPGKQGLALFRQLRKRGVAVRVLTNSLASTDLKIAHGGYSRYRRALLELGVELFEFKSRPRRQRAVGSENSSFGGSSLAGLHIKAYVIDRRLVAVGSFNHDPRSATLNTELGLLVHSLELADQASDLFDALTKPENAYRLELEKGKNERIKLQWRTKKDGREIIYHQEPMAGWWQRFRTRLMSLFAPEGLL